MPKIIRSYIKLFENNRMFNVLNMTSRLVSVCVATFIYILTQDGYIAFASLFIGVLGVDLIFFILRLRESQFKSALFFEKNETSQKTMNKYTTAMLCIRMALMILALCPVIIADGFSSIHLSNVIGLYMVISYVCNFFLSGFFTKYETDLITRKDEDDCFSISDVDGIPGYNSAGVYTGSPTAIGGMSD